MTNAMYKDIYIKTIRVIEGSKTREQFKVATEYFKLSSKYMSQIHTDMLFTQWLVKNEQLENSGGLAASQT